MGGLPEGQAMSRDSGGAQRIWILGLLLALLAGVFAWRWRTADKPLRDEQAEVAAAAAASALQKAARERRYDEPIEALHADRLAAARKASRSIAELRQECHEQATGSGRGRGIPIPSPLQTRETALAESLRFRLREVEAYRTGTRDAGAAKEAGAKFLEAVLTRQVGQNAGIDLDAVRTLAAAADAAGSRDPMVRVYRAVTPDRADEDPAASQAELEAVVQELAGVEKPGPALLTAQLELWRRSGEFGPKREKAWRASVPTIVAWLETEASDPQWRRGACERVWRIWSHLAAAERQRLVAALLLDGDRVDSYLVHLLIGSHFADRGWVHVGGTGVKGVSPGPLVPHRGTLDLAAAHLQYAWSLDPRLPYAPMQLIGVADNDGPSGPAEEDPHFWFLRATEGCFDDQQIYDTFARSLQKRGTKTRPWLYDFAADCIDTGRFDLVVPYVAIDVLRRVAHTELKPDETLAGEPQAVHLGEQFVLARKRFQESRPDAPLFDSNGVYRAGIVLLLEDCGLRNEAAAFLSEVGETLYWPHLQARSRPGRYLAARRRAALGEIEGRVVAFDEALRAPLSGPAAAAELGALEKEFRDLREAAAGNEGSKDFFEHADVMLAQRRAFLSGEWVTLPLDGALRGSEPYADSWRPAREGTGIELFGRSG